MRFGKGMPQILKQRITEWILVLNLVATTMRILPVLLKKGKNSEKVNKYFKVYYSYVLIRIDGNEVASSY